MAMGGHGWGLVGMGGHMSCYVWAWVGTGVHIHAMGGHRSSITVHGWTWVEKKLKMLVSAL